MKYNYSVESVNAISASVNKFEGLKEANKEVKSLSGAIRICTAQKFWEAGYNKAFSQFGFTDRKSLTLQKFFEALHPSFIETGKDRNGKKFTAIKLWSVRTQTTGQGADRKPVTDVAGQPVKEVYLKTVKSFSPVILLKILAQSDAEKNA